jgi:hypothetical protein
MRTCRTTTRTSKPVGASSQLHVVNIHV